MKNFRNVINRISEKWVIKSKGTKKQTDQVFGTHTEKVCLKNLTHSGQRTRSEYPIRQGYTNE